VLGRGAFWSTNYGAAQEGFVTGRIHAKPQRLVGLVGFALTKRCCVAAAGREGTKGFALMNLNGCYGSSGLALKMAKPQIDIVRLLTWSGGLCIEDA